MIIEGSYVPCKPCRGAMNSAARASGAEIYYLWGDQMWKAGN